MGSNPTNRTKNAMKQLVNQAAFLFARMNKTMGISLKAPVFVQVIFLLTCGQSMPAMV